MPRIQKDEMEHLYIVIMAGGTGTRLWPLSRKEKPKQFQALFSSQTLLAETYRRAKKVLPEKNIYISTVSNYQNLVLETIPGFQEDHLILEPSPRGTAGAIALVAQAIHEIDPLSVVATLASDHVIKNDSEFVIAIQTALEVAKKQSKKLVIVGINPTYPNTELGYIKMGEELENTNSHKKRVFTVDSFKEKPDQKTAEKYLADWEYLWNAGYFIFSSKHFLEMVQQYIPKTLTVIKKMSSLDKIASEKREKLYETIENEPIDTALLEKLSSHERIVVPSELQWSDIGNWRSLFDFLIDGNEHESNIVSRGEHIDVGSKNCFVHTRNKLVATLCLEDIVIVETNDALLVARKDCAHEVKKIIDILKSQGKKNYL